MVKPDNKAVYPGHFLLMQVCFSKFTEYNDYSFMKSSKHTQMINNLHSSRSRMTLHLQRFTRLRETKDGGGQSRLICHTAYNLRILKYSKHKTASEGSVRQQ